MQGYSNAYIIGFAAAVCTFCSVFVSGSAVALKERQVANEVLELKKNVVQVSGFLDPEKGETVKTLSVEKIDGFFLESAAEKIETLYVDLKTGSKAEGYDDKKLKADTKECPKFDNPKENPAKLRCKSKVRKVYKVIKDGKLDRVILPVEGKGLWSTMYGFIALSADTKTVKGITFYKHGETPGLGGEIDNKSWQAQWEGLQAFDNDGKPAIVVRKGGRKNETTEVDGLSGATLTAIGVQHLAQYWLGDNAYGPFLATIKGGN